MSAEEWLYTYNLLRDQLIRACSEKIHVIFTGFPTIEIMLRQDVHEASSIDELKDLSHELAFLQDILGKAKGV